MLESILCTLGAIVAKANERELTLLSDLLHEFKGMVGQDLGWSNDEMNLFHGGQKVKAISARRQRTNESLSEVVALARHLYDRNGWTW